MGSFILVVPANTRDQAAVIPVDSIIPVGDLQMKQYIDFTRVEAWKTGDPGIFYNARASNLLKAMGMETPRAIYSDIIITNKGCIPLTQKEASLMVRFMNRRN